MNKLPVVPTIVEAYRFAFGHLGTIIGLIWLPMVLATLLNFLPELSGAAGDTNTSPLAAGTGALESVAILVLTQLLYAIIYVAVTRQALGLRKGSAIIHFSLGPSEFRMFGATLLFLLISFGCVLTFAMLILSLTALMTAQSGSVAVALLGGLGALAGGFVLVYVLLRLGFLLTPVTVVENRIDLSRGWALTQGNFGRVLLVLIAVAAPIFIIETGAVLAVMGRELLAALPPVGSSDTVVQQHVLMLEEIFRRHTPEILGVTLILAPFNLGLSISASAFGYRALAPEAAREIRT